MHNLNITQSGNLVQFSTIINGVKHILLTGRIESKRDMPRFYNIARENLLELNAVLNQRWAA
jgi:hypothetical protein